MKSKVWINLSLVILLVVVIAGVAAAMVYFMDLPQRISQHETIVLGQNRFIPGSQAALRVVTRDSKDAAPIENAEIRVSLRPDSGGDALLLYEGYTDEHGDAEVVFDLPVEAEPDQTLIIQTSSSLGSDTIEQPVTLSRDFKVLLTTDKPIYQPGQQIHIRTLALSTFDLTPAMEADIEITVADGKGNKVFRRELKTSEWGVAAVDFQLASQVNTGAYQITAVLGNTSSQKTVTVEHYVLPKFDLTLETEKSFYMPGEHVQGSLQADYFFGKPVAGGQVEVKGYTFDVERVDAVSLQGTTDEGGRFEFEFDLPVYMAGTDLEAGSGRFYLQAEVTDLARNSENASQSLPVSREGLVIDAIPEGGSFKPGVENRLYVLTSYPDGSPAETSITIQFHNTGERVSLESGAFGLADIPYTPSDPWQNLSIQAWDGLGNNAEREFYFEGQWHEETVLLRPGRPVYRVGDTLDLTILTSALAGTAYLDIIREGQTLNTRAVDITEGVTQVAVDLTPDLYGTLELHAYKILSSGQITRDTRLVVVDNAEDLNLMMAARFDSYLPGENATVDIQVRDQAGSGTQAAIGLAVVDESVFALAEQDPGFAKLYFMLESELLQPKYDLHGYSLPDLIAGGGVSSPEFEAAIEDAAQASLAEAVPQRAAFSLQANSHDEALQQAYRRQSNYFGYLSQGLFGLFLVIMLVPMVLAVAGAAGKKHLGRSLLVALGLLGFPILLLVIWPHPWANGPLGKLGVFFDWLSWRGAVALLMLSLLAILGWIVLMVIAVRRKDVLLGWKLGLIPVILALLVMLVVTVSQADLNPGSPVLIMGLMAFLLVPLAFFVRFTDFLWTKNYLGAAAILPVAVFLLAGVLPLTALGSGGIAAAGRGVKGFMAVPGMQMLDGAVQVEEVMNMEVGFDLEMEDGENWEEKDATRKADDGSTPKADEPPRLRQYFPETMIWLPQEISDDNGDLQVEFPVADSITTWRITALASTQDGRLGSATASLRVFQDFFIDLDLPLALTVGDEVSVPVGVFNYLEEPQTIRMVLEEADWFELVDQAEKEVEIGANDISVVYFRIRATRFGQQPFQVTAWGSQMSDAILKEVRVYPNGKQIHFTQSNRLETQNPVQEIVDIPAEALPGTQKLTVKIYPGVLSQVVEGLESILRMPYGCFEQTSSTTYPNVLVLDYLKFTDQAAPEVQFKAEEYINLGYQRLATFEVGGSGGFSLFGDPPPDRMLTAYGLQEFSDMSQVHNVDPALVQRAAEWLFSQQAGDGSWENDRGLVHENTWANLGDDRLPVSAYIVWSLMDSGFGDDPRTKSGLAYVKENSTKAEDAYVLALIANALVAADIHNGADITPVTLAILDRLAEMAIQEEIGATWRSGVATFMGSEGQTNSIETTALVAYAFLRANRYPQLANAALTSLIQQKDSFGTWYSTQATVLSLKALIQSVKMGVENTCATVTIRLNEGQTRVLKVTPENFDVVQMVTFEDVNVGRENLVEISTQGEGQLMYQISGSYYLPWEEIAKYPQLTGGGDLVAIELGYDRTELAVNDTVGVEVVVSLKEGQAQSALIDLGLPPGFSVETEDLAALVARFDDIPEDYPLPTIERFELTGRQILVYVSNLTAEHPLVFNYRLRAKFPLFAQTPASNAYDYYNPEVNGEVEPVMLRVEE